jgi:hypothetical protein
VNEGGTNQNGNIDERIDRLVARHEALAQSLELLTADVRSLQSSVADLAETARRHDQNLGRHDKYLGTIMEATSQLLQVAQIHERRRTRLEGQEGT